MSWNPQTREPSSLTAGDTLIFSAVFTKYPITAGWSLSYFGILDGGGTGSTFTFTSTTPDTTGQGWAFSVPPGTTGNWKPGWYQVQSQVSNVSGETHTVASFRFQVIADIAADGTADLRSPARITLNNIQAVLQNRATQSIMESNIEGMLLRKIPLAELILLHDKYMEIVRSEDDALRIKAGLGSRRRIMTRFSGCGTGGPGSHGYKEWLQ
jgi:hypothetical protein